MKMFIAVPIYEVDLIIYLYKKEQRAQTCSQHY